jgi:hopanoid biosynthesis associated protein HpnK
MQVIFNADDFGRSESINTAVVKAHRGGILSSASLMVAGEGFEDAVKKANDNPSLAVGLHLVVVEGKAILPPSEIPHLVDSNGYFSANPLKAGLAYYFSRAHRSQLKREIQAQFDRFVNAGLPLSHVDGHLHMHIHPTVFRTLLPLARQYGACGVRLPRDNFWLSVRYKPERIGTKILWALVFSLMTQWSQRALIHGTLISPQRVFGLMQSGKMHKNYVVQALSALKAPTAEMYFHPDLRDSDPGYGPNRGDLEALLSPEVHEVLEQRDIHRSTYAQMRAKKEGSNDR